MIGKWHLGLDIVNQDGWKKNGGVGDAWIRADVVEAGRVWGLSQTGRFGEAKAGLADAARAARRLPVAGFPAVLPAALARRPEAGALEKRLRLLWAAVRGRL